MACFLIPPLFDARSGGTRHNLWMKLTPQKLEGCGYRKNFIILTSTVFIDPPV